MTPQPHQQPAAAADPRTPFEKFRDLTRSILTTPKTTAEKDEPKKAKKKRK